ncbi:MULTISPECIES: phosphate/phosphite/phosphonate ABC transporter substrate-binding protein [Mycobacteriaceae]|uniref:Phosphate starvation-inducible protein PhoH n=1 Tax=Mycolicibacterium phlei DSM 43239 = CCUG 21000 TaxID=1226750 RepID=A0A5N5UYJ8_MYCPH|nr:Phosphate-import protein PhnD precursor [Mycolicibacterium phlei]KAB7754725.1 phosphate starvation-inducible protein PhoH [Mycolicibacterium phlei DSM 43239 = CCUG 21000]KXW65369.1 phosphate starvation-inducible protein PhoH [Mycolicibacterium phlei DSM 43239 = CCUG 21000]VEG11977.1 phosphonate-binding periplasmic protein [Mycobacteroides chelonae]
MRSHPVARLMAVAACAALTLVGCSSGDSGSDGPNAEGFPDTITLAAIPAENSTDMRASYEPLIKLLEKETGSKVEFVQASDYAGVVEGMIADNVDLAFFGPFAYVVAKLNGARITPLGAVIAEEGADPGYRSYGLARADNEAVNGLPDFAGKKVCFVDPVSTSGFLYPTAGLIEAGVITSGSEADISAAMTPIFAGGHDASALAIKNGDCDAGFAFDSMVDETMVAKGDLAPGELKTVWKSEMIAGSVFAANESLGPEVIDKLKTIFAEKANVKTFEAEGFCTGDACLIADERVWGVVPVDDTAYDGVRKVCDITGSEKCKG